MNSTRKITALAAVATWMADYNDVHPHSRLGYRSPREYIRAQSQLAAYPPKFCAQGHSKIRIEIG